MFINLGIRMLLWVLGGGVGKVWCRIRRSEEEEEEEEEEDIKRILSLPIITRGLSDN